MIKKAVVINDIENEWASQDDYIYCTVFGVQQKIDEANRKVAADRQVAAGKRAFVPNQFPYQIHAGYHYVLWYAHNQTIPITDALIDDHVRSEISHLLSLNSTNDQNFDYCWYENPKQSVPSVYHLQVFWTTL